MWVLLCQLDTNLPRTTFYKVVQQLVGPKADYIRPLSNGPLLMYPSNKSDFFISQTLTRSQQRGGMFSSESESSEDEEWDRIEFARGNIFQEMVHAALRVRQDLLDTPGHSDTWQGLDQEHVDKVIPNSLYFLRLLFGGTYVVDEGFHEDTIVKQSVCSIA